MKKINAHNTPMPNWQCEKKPYAGESNTNLLRNVKWGDKGQVRKNTKFDKHPNALLDYIVRSNTC